ncbi:hypothetical protein [Allosphingosinicella vermicomposti]|uniref:hypothetical protein n=1 Tax=Allosphingosinicella vermicomposti TaxID=614671 RepID=UPI00131A56DB|nr:hypothetical protein [Allosphingosinicella vermicomposti]
MLRFLQILAAAMMALLPHSGLVAQTYNGNAVVKITGVFTYTTSNYVLFTVEEKPAGIACEKAYFGLPLNMTDAARQIVVARLLLAYSLKEPVNIGFDATGPCIADEFIWVARVG